MAAEFIGSTVLITLRSPPNGQVRGVVADIVGQQLTLNDVSWLASGHRSPKFSIDASNIIDLEVAPEATPYDKHQAHPSISTPTVQASEDGLPSSPLPRVSLARVLPSPTPSSHGAHPKFVDPAILSYGKASPKPESELLRSSPQARHFFISKELPVDTVMNDPTRGTPAIPLELSVSATSHPKQVLGDELAKARQDSLVNATLSEPFDDLPLSAKLKTEDDWAWDALEIGAQGTNREQAQLEHVGAPVATSIRGSKQSGKRVRRGTRGGHRTRNVGVQATAPSTQHTEGVDSTILATKLSKSSNNSKVQNQTPLVEADASVVASPSAYHQDSRNWQEKRASRRERTKNKAAQNGWATEDATDIQEMGSFDFAANLSKFDKREVFNQLRRDDDTADEARLVSYNRVPKPGTGGGKNLHWTENVLSPPHLPQLNGHGKWTSEAGESENDPSDVKISSERSSRRETSRNSFRRPQSRKDSAKLGESQNLVVSRLATSSLGIVRYSSLDQGGSPRPGRNMSISPFTGSISTPRPLLKIIGSNKTCPCLSPLQMLEFEQFAVSELGLSEDMMTENAARGIAETCLSIGYSENKDQRKHDRASNSIIVIAAGNHKTGARAIAAGRHLRNHGSRVTVTVMGLDREEDLLDAVKQQANAYRKNGGTLLKPNELLEGLKSGSLQPTILIDALLGIHACFDDLRLDDQAFFFGLIIWVNRALIEVLSVDVPSGLDASSGELTIVDDQPLALSPRIILSLGAPKTWLLATLRDGGDPDQTQIFVADIGISNLAWRRLGNRRRGIDFGREWVIQLHYQPGID